jgi:hypothetical protein
MKEALELHSTICVDHNHTQTNKSNVNKTHSLLQTTVGKNEPNIGGETIGSNLFDSFGK